VSLEIDANLVIQQTARSLTVSAGDNILPVLVSGKRRGICDQIKYASVRPSKSIDIKINK
jgi:hypothetical protein